MRIISKFHDYYDSVMAYGYDDDGYVYVRHTEELPPEAYNLFPADMLSDVHQLRLASKHFHHEEFIHRITLIGFCGKIYPAIQITDPRHGLIDGVIYDGKTHTFLTIEAAVKWIESNLHKSYLHYFQMSDWRPWEKKSIEQEHYKYFDKWSGIESAEIFIKYNTPVFASIYSHSDNKYMMYRNPVLTNLSFFTQFGSFEAYGEIDMYVCGVLGNTEDNMIDISDEVRRDQKGFDKWSFKNKPTKKR